MVITVILERKDKKGAKVHCGNDKTQAGFLSSSSRIGSVHACSSNAQGAVLKLCPDVNHHHSTRPTARAQLQESVAEPASDLISRPGPAVPHTSSCSPLRAASAPSYVAVARPTRAHDAYKQLTTPIPKFVAHETRKHRRSMQRLCNTASQGQ